LAVAMVSQVLPQSYLANTRTGFGFVVTASRGEPVFSATYATRERAEKAREEIIKALEDAVDIFG
jgi:hypothetical protein